MQCLQWLESNTSSHQFTVSDDSAGDIYSALNRHLPKQSSLLELGAGHGFDLPPLAARFRVTASDLCEARVAGLRKAYPSLPVLQLDAITIPSLRRFDAIFSNKLMQHLTDEEMHCSLQRQRQVVHVGGLVAHTFWVNRSGRLASGNACPVSIIAEHFEIAEIMQYGAYMPNDSLLVIARNSRIAA